MLIQGVSVPWIYSWMMELTAFNGRMLRLLLLSFYHQLWWFVSYLMGILAVFIVFFRKFKRLNRGSMVGWWMIGLQTSALPTLRQALRQLPHAGHCWTSTARVWAHWAPLDLNLGPSELSEHRWTSTWDPPSSVSTARPQPGTLRAQWAPLDLNLGPSELSEHRWPSTAR